jgi:beta-N-acetylhexosaminidase
LVGGVILFSRNYKNKKQIKALTASIRKIKKNILIAVDHEGGRVQRFREEFTEIPDMALLGQIYDENKAEGKRLAKLCGQLIAYELGACDIDFSFTPVLDINFGTSSVIGDRSFHQHAKPIVDLASSVMDGLSSGGMKSVGKHFPGHGFIKADTHLESANDDRSLEEIQEKDMNIFKEMIKKNIAGAIFSDDMGMMAAQIYEKDLVSRVRKCLEAGCDMVLVCNQGDNVDKVLNKLLWKQDSISKERLSNMRRDYLKNNEGDSSELNFCYEGAKKAIKELKK